jgi:hypothetical protein
VEVLEKHWGEAKPEKQILIKRIEANPLGYFAYMANLLQFSHKVKQKMGKDRNCINSLSAEK